MSKQRKSKRSKVMRAAAATIRGFRDIVASKWTQAKQQRHNSRQLGTFGAASPVRIIVKDGEAVQAKPAVTKKATFKRLKPSEFMMLKRERKERDQDVFFNKRNGGSTIAVRAAAAEKEWRQKLNLDANLHRTSRKAGTR